MSANMSDSSNVNNYVNRLSDKEFKSILDSPNGDRDYLINKVDLNLLDPSKLIILTQHPSYITVRNGNIMTKTPSVGSDKLPDEKSVSNKFQVVKRDGRTQYLEYEKVYERMKKLWESSTSHHALSSITEADLRRFCDIVIKCIYNKISTSELDEQAANIAANLITTHYEYGYLASRIIISNHGRNLRRYSFTGIIDMLYNNKDANGRPFPLVSVELYKFVGINRSWIEAAIDYKRDFNYDFFGFKTLERSYLIKSKRVVWERPQDMLMRVSIGIWVNSSNIIEVSPTSTLAKNILNTYHGMSQGYFTHASPTLFNSGTPNHQFLSCFLFEVGDSLDSIMSTLYNACQISKYAGGNGGHIHTIRSTGAEIKGTNGESSGPIKFTHIYGKGMEAFDQGGRRKGALAFYMSPEHPEFIDFVELRTTHGDPATKSRILFIGTWIPDLFWYRWLKDDKWSMFDPNETMTGGPDTEDGKKYGANRYLAKMYGEQYEARYKELEDTGRTKKTMKVHEMLIKIATAQMGSGMPYMCYKDEANRCSNQRNVGIIHSSNLCTEIFEYSDEDEYACCTLASICLTKYVFDTYTAEELKLREAGEQVRELNHKYPTNPKFDFAALAKHVRIATRNLDHIIDINSYPVVQTKLSNLRHRPLGNGVQGLADVFHKMKIAWGSEESITLNDLIFETIYYAALTESCEIAHELYKQYKSSIKKEGKVRVPVDYNIVPVIKRTFVSKFDANGREYKRQKYITENVVEPVYNDYTSITDLPTTAGAYTTFVGSPLHEGKFQFDLRNEEAEYINARNQVFFDSMSEDDIKRLCGSFGSMETLKSIMYRKTTKLSGMWDWESLRIKIKTFGVRNSQLVALMPTSSTSQIMGNNECIEPFTENIFKRTTLAGDFIVVNPYLIKELTDLCLWNKNTETNIVVNNGSVQYLDGPEELKDIIDDIKYRYRTSFEIPQSVLIDLAANRQAFVDQGQSLNLHMRDGTDLHSIIGMHFYAWARGLKTGMYYLRMHPAISAQKFTINITDIQNLSAKKVKKERDLSLPQENVCLSCSS